MGIVLVWNSTYPATIDDQVTNFPTVSDNTHDVLSSHVNELAKAVVAVETVVGGLRTTPIAEPLSPINGEVLTYNSVSGDWESGTGTVSTLQLAYTGGNIIAVNSTEGSPTISNTVDTTHLLTLSRTFAGAGDGISVVMGASTTGNAISLSQRTGYALYINTDNAGVLGAIAMDDSFADNLVQLSSFGISYSGGGNDFSINGGTPLATTGFNARTCQIIGGIGGTGLAAASPVSAGLGGTVLCTGGVGGAAEGTSTGGELGSDAGAGAGVLLSSGAGGAGSAGTVDPGHPGVGGNTNLFAGSGGAGAGTSDNADGGSIFIQAGNAGAGGSGAVASSGAIDILTSNSSSGVTGASGHISLRTMLPTGIGQAGDLLFKSEAGTQGTAGGILLSVSTTAGPSTPLSGQILLETTGELQIDANTVDINSTGAVDIAATQIFGPAGSDALPSYSFSSFPTTGMQATASLLRFSVNGVLKVAFHANGLRNINGSAALPSITFIGLPNTGVYLNNLTIPTLGLSVEGGDAALIRRVLDEATGDEVFLDLSSTVNKATSGNYTGIKLNVTETLAPGTDDRLLDLQVGGVSKFHVTNAGEPRAPIGDTSNIPYAFDTEPDTGMYATSASLNFAVNGTLIGSLRSPGFRNINGTAALPAYAYHTQADTGIYLNDTTIPTLGIAVEGGDAVIIRRVLDEATGDEVFFDLSTMVNKATSGNYTGIKLNVDKILNPGADSRLMDLQVGGVSKFYISDVGDVFVLADLTHSGAGKLGFYGAPPAAQGASYTRSATVVEDRILVASAQSTVKNNNNVLAALIIDLQTLGLIG